MQPDASAEQSTQAAMEFAGGELDKGERGRGVHGAYWEGRHWRGHQGSQWFGPAVGMEGHFWSWLSGGSRSASVQGGSSPSG